MALTTAAIEALTSTQVNALTASQVTAITGVGWSKMTSTTAATIETDLTITGTTGADTITVGTISIHSITGGAGLDAITLGSSNGVVDTITMTGDSIGLTVDTVANFTVASDVLEIDLSELNAAVTTMNQGAGATALVTDATPLATVTTLTAATTVAAAQIYLISYATAFTTSTLETALEAAGNLAITTYGIVTAGDGFLVAYDDGANSYLASVVSAAGAASGATFVSGDLTVTNLIQLTGITDASTLTTADFSIVT